MSLCTRSKDSQLVAGYAAQLEKQLEEERKARIHLQAELRDIKTLLQKLVAAKQQSAK